MYRPHRYAWKKEETSGAKSNRKGSEESLNAQEECSKQKEMDDKLNEHGKSIRIKTNLPIDKTLSPNLFVN